MYHLPKNFDGAFLVGRRLQMVCFAAFQVYLHFDDEIMITVEYAYSYRSNDTQIGTEAMITILPISQSNLMQLLEKAVSKVQRIDGDSLTMLFENGDALTLCNGPENFESYQIKYGDQNIIV